MISIHSFHWDAVGVLVCRCSPKKSISSLKPLTVGSEPRMYGLGLPLGPPMKDPYGDPIFDGKSEEFHIGDVVTGPFGPLGSRKVGIALFGLYYNNDRLVRVRWADEYSIVSSHGYSLSFRDNTR